MTPEPEETIEANAIALLDAAEPGFAVVGALQAAPDGVEKLSPLSCINVTADVASQNMDWTGPGCPCTYTLRVTVQVAYADDKNGALFRNTCRKVRGVFNALTGDGCAALSGDGFFCDSLLLDNTNTSNAAVGDGVSNYKLYSATVTGRFIPPPENEEA